MGAVINPEGYHVNYDPVDVCFPPFVENVSTAIAVVLTEHGIAIAADGLECEVGTYLVLKTRAQKIFPVSEHGWLAYCVAGVVGATNPDSDEVLFDFAVGVPDALRDLPTTDMPTLYHFVETVATRLLTAFKSAIKGLPRVREQITRILFVGYYRGPEAVQLTFTHAANARTFYSISDIKLRLDVPIGYGSTPIWDRLYGIRDDPDFTKYRPLVSSGDAMETKGINIVSNCIRAHCDPIALVIDPEICRAIGGLHTAKITEAKGFEWATPPKARRSANR